MKSLLALLFATVVATIVAPRTLSAAQAGSPDYGGIAVDQLLQRDNSGADNWTALSNGKDLAGWTVKIRGHNAGDNYKDTFRVVDGVIQVSYAGYDKFGDRFGHLFYNTPYSRYILSLDYRFTGDQVKGGAGWAFENSGVMIHSQAASSMELDQDFPISVEVQLLGGTGESDRPTANVCTPGTHIEIAGELRRSHCIDSSSKTYPGPQWVHLDVVVLGDELIEHRINGSTVLSYNKPVLSDWWLFSGQPLKSGYISLQSESHPVEFKNIELLDLSNYSGSKIEITQ